MEALGQAVYVHFPLLPHLVPAPSISYPHLPGCGLICQHGPEAASLVRGTRALEQDSPVDVHILSFP